MARATMRRVLSIAIVSLGLGSGLVLAAPAIPDPIVLLEVDDGNFFYDGSPTDEVCRGTTNDRTKGEATRHWHVGVPGRGPGLDEGSAVSTEPTGGFGCLGGPKSWTVEIVDGKIGVATGGVTYTWDQNVEGGGRNDVHLHVLDAEGATIYSTLDDDGPQPIHPLAAERVLRHDVAFVLGPGSYRVVEDVYSGEHTAWLTKLAIVEEDEGFAQPVAGVRDVTISGFAYAPGEEGAATRGDAVGPATLVIGVGDTLAATNLDPVAHTITSRTAGLFDSGSVGASGQSGVVDTSRLPPGEYPFFCRFHDTMAGVLLVTADP